MADKDKIEMETLKLKEQVAKDNLKLKENTKEEERVIKTNGKIDGQLNNNKENEKVLKGDNSQPIESANNINHQNSESPNKNEKVLEEKAETFQFEKEVTSFLLSFKL